MNEIEKKYCIQIMNKMLIMHLFEPMEQDSTKNKESNPSHGIIDLNNVLFNLQNNQYSSIYEWKKSIQNIWLVPLKSYKQDTINYLFAKEQKDWFEKHFIKIPHNSFEDWHVRIKKISKEIKNLLHSPPEEVVKPIILQNDIL